MLSSHILLAQYSFLLFSLYPSLFVHSPRVCLNNRRFDNGQRRRAVHGSDGGDGGGGRAHWCRQLVARCRRLSGVAGSYLLHTRRTLRYRGHHSFGIVAHSFDSKLGFNFNLFKKNLTCFIDFLIWLNFRFNWLGYNWECRITVGPRRRSFIFSIFWWMRVCIVQSSTFYLFIFSFWNGFLIRNVYSFWFCS